MKNMLTTFLIAAALYPNLDLTPGATNPELAQEVICSPAFRTGTYRMVPVKEKRKVFARYHIDWSHRREYEVDHLISLELGGSNDIRNLWPEAYWPRPGAHEKDKVENFLHREVCKGTITLQEAQKEIVQDWYAIYKKVYSEESGQK